MDFEIQYQRKDSQKEMQIVYSPSVLVVPTKPGVMFVSWFQGDVLIEKFFYVGDMLNVYFGEVPYYIHSEWEDRQGE